MLYVNTYIGLIYDSQKKKVEGVCVAIMKLPS